MRILKVPSGERAKVGGVEIASTLIVLVTSVAAAARGIFAT
ncbi:hypothetical protein [Gordonia sp. CPCC 205333]